MENDNNQLIKKTARIAPDSNMSHIYANMDDKHLYLDDDDSYIYGDVDATTEDTIETMTVYDPDSERYEDIESSSADEVVNCYAYSRKTGENLDRVALNDVHRVLSNNGQFIWLGLYDPSLKTMVKVKEAFGLHELAIEDAFADHQRAKVENYDNDMVFVVLRTAKLEDNVIRYGTTAIFMGKNYLITIRNGPSNSYAPVREHCHRRPEKLRMGPIFVLHAILDFIVDNYMPITDRLGRYLREQERYVFTSEFDKGTLKNLYELKSQLVHMRAIILPVQDICSFFINHKKSEIVSGFSQAAKPYFRDVNDHLLHSLDAINGLNEMLSVVMNTYMAMVNMGQNEVVRKLAAWAGILAVPTAIAGIYGMNFDFMPELHWKYAYLVIMAIIITLCSYLYYNFKRLKWL
ncbi:MULTISPECIES: magnesium/cobalt transporter CorA [unclassified Psychrobacter]|uniref:magnesium/cobalt transporter CorA n=1 Tax=unclassified Psychrobacter TaxID=196806 RepID=UPI0025B461D1|nr:MULTISPECIES: magnesium/cobalt transporter CorA [unclassified Psychrobacter]MDN3454244.1 magnesium/cobalt transporter CorA [Psychrobacter sp. APC 3350]MDN3501323.1 magnesium/cobalt transporter CorA [Psychrobacter sp. 5A.1]